MSAYKPPKPPARWEAQWIWHPPQEDMDNFHLLLRQELLLDSTPEQAICWVSANSIYELYINGRCVGRGPSPSYPKWQYFDCYEVGEFLKQGPNVIAAHCYNFGPTMESVLRQDPGPGGFLFQLDIEGQTVLVSDSSWGVLHDPSQQQRTEPISGHRGGFKEVCDANGEVTGWQQAEFDDSAWQPAHVLGVVGCEPWENLIPREIPPLRRERILPRDVFYHTCGRTYGAQRYDVSAPEALRQDDDSCTVVEPLRPDFAPSLIVDFGVNTFGYYEIEIADSAGGTIEISYGESLNLTLVDRFIMRPGPQTYRPFERRGGRYLMLTFRDCPGPVKLRRVVCYRQSYPVEYRGQFRCSDELLNRVWEIGRYTVQMCMQDHYEDCPWREQTLYCGDLAVGALLSYYAFGTQDLARKSLRQLARLQDKDGLIPPQGPAPWPGTCLPEYPAFWVISLWDYYIHWADKDLIEELFPNVVRCMDWYAAHHDEVGLFARRQSEGVSRFIDNLSNIPAETQLAAEQIIYCQAVRCAAAMAEALGGAQLSADLNERATNLAATIKRLFWREGNQCLIDSLEPDGDTVTQITNGLALLYDIVRPERRAALIQVLLDPTKAPPMRAGYMNFYMVEALVGAGLYREALERIREYWGGMIGRGATTFWETYDPESPEGTIPQRLWSLCHEFCAGPVYSLPAHFAGIRARKPGFALVEFAPRLLDLDWVQAAVPTPRGEIRLICRQNRQTKCLELQVSLPPQTGAEILIPLPGRDIGTVYLDGQPVPADAEGETVRKIKPALAATRTEADGLRLHFDSGPDMKSLRLATRRERVLGTGGNIITRPWGQWDATPNPD